jgi:hypothetical protein
MLNKQSRLLLFNFLICFPLIGCGVISDQNVDPSKNNQATFRKDLRECKEDYPETGSGVHIRQWQGCMKLKGWR